MLSFSHINMLSSDDGLIGLFSTKFDLNDTMLCWLSVKIIKILSWSFHFRSLHIFEVSIILWSCSKIWSWWLIWTSYITILRKCGRGQAFEFTFNRFYLKDCLIVNNCSSCNNSIIVRINELLFIPTHLVLAGSWLRYVW